MWNENCLHNTGTGWHSSWYFSSLNSIHYLIRQSFPFLDMPLFSAYLELSNLHLFGPILTTVLHTFPVLHNYSLKYCVPWAFPISLLLLLPLSRFSRVQLCGTPQTAAHQALPFLGFSRQEHWSGLPFPSPVHESEKWKWSHSDVSNSLRPHGLQPTRLLCPWGFPGKRTGEFHGQMSLAGYSLWGCKESDMTEWLILFNNKERRKSEEQRWLYLF